MATELRGKKILVTGATGLIGSNVALRLQKEGARVRGMVRNITKGEALTTQGIEVVKGDMTDTASLENAVQGIQIVFHFAAVLGDEFKSWSYFRAVNVDGTRALAEASLATRIERFVHCSTCSVYGLDAGPNTDEDSPRHPSNDKYCDTKLEAENLIRSLIQQRGLPAVIVQPSQVYGPGDETWTLGPIRLIESGRMMLPDGGKGLIQPIYIDDLVTGILSAARLGRIGEAYILCGDKPILIREFFDRLAHMIGRDKLPSVPGWTAITIATLSEWGARLTRQPPISTRGALRHVMLHATYNCSKAQKELGFATSTSLEVGMQEIRNWLQDQGCLNSIKGK